MKDLPVEKGKSIEDDYEDLTDSDDLLDDNGNSTQHDLKVELPTSTRLNKRKKLTAQLNTRKRFWTVKLRGKLAVSKRSQYSSESKLGPSKPSDGAACICTSLKSLHSIGSGDRDFNVQEIRRLSLNSEESHLDTEAGNAVSAQELESVRQRTNNRFNQPLPYIPNFNTLYPINDIDEQRIAQRRFEMEHGIVERDNDVWVLGSQQEDTDPEPTADTEGIGQYPSYGAMGLLSPEACPGPSTERPLRPTSASGSTTSSCISLSCVDPAPWVRNVQRPRGVHTQVDYKHHLVPDMEGIVSSSFYWGVMDRYQAEKLIENKPEGTFLLRDSAQDEFLFSVSFRRYGRSLHARIEQWNHRFSFDSRDPGVFAASTVRGLIEHYKDPSCCMFFEPMLTLPMHRNFPFSLQHISRAVISSRVSYDGINRLPLPARLKEYLQFYHYKQKVRVRRFDNVVS